MECEKCPIVEECNRIQETVKDTKLAKSFSTIKIKFCPLAFAAAKTAKEGMELWK
jgi:hypothetical protein